MRASLQRLVMEDYDERIVLHVESPVAEDKAHQLAVMSKAPHAFQTDEWREAAGWDALGGELGKAYLVPLNSFVTPDPLDPETRPQSKPATPPGAEKPEDEENEKPPKPGEEEDAA